MTMKRLSFSWPLAALAAAGLLAGCSTPPDHFPTLRPGLAPAPAVSDQVRWTIECLPSDASLGPVDAGRYRALRTAVRDAAGPAPAADTGVEESQQRFDRVARGHSDTVRLVAEDIAGALRATAGERARTCIAGH